MTAVTRSDSTTRTAVVRPADGGAPSLVELQRAGRRLLMKRTPLGGAGAVRQGVTLTPASDQAVLDGIATSIQAGPAALTLSAGDQAWSATLTPLGNSGVRLEVEDLADVTLPLEGDDDTTTSSAMTGLEVVALLIIVMTVAMVAEMIVTDSDGAASEVEVKPADPPPPTP